MNQPREPKGVPAGGRYSSIDRDETAVELDNKNVLNRTLLARGRRKVTDEAARVAGLGGWPDWIPPGSLATRIPEDLDRTAPGGFDAGIACGMGMIPEDKQRLSASFHAAYTPERIGQARDEIAAGLDPDSETCWWLAACSVCREGNVNGDEFLNQLNCTPT